MIDYSIIGKRFGRFITKYYCDTVNNPCTTVTNPSTLSNTTTAIKKEN